jgi:AcrR family transcriptional regulator
MAKHGQEAGHILPRDRVVDALMALATEMEWDRIGLNEIAARANLSLLELRDLFPSKGAILGAFARRIDHEVLSQNQGDPDRPIAERLLDVMMLRFSALQPYHAALKAMAPAMARDPLSLSALNQVALNSMRYMLAAAGIDGEGPLGFVKTQGAVLAFARAMEVWFRDETPDHADTRHFLESEIRRGGFIVNRFEDVMRAGHPIFDMMSRIAKGTPRQDAKPRDYDPSI